MNEVVVRSTYRPGAHKARKTRSSQHSGWVCHDGDGRVIAPQCAAGIFALTATSRGAIQSLEVPS